MDDSKLDKMKKEMKHSSLEMRPRYYDRGVLLMLSRALQYLDPLKIVELVGTKSKGISRRVLFEFGWYMVGGICSVYDDGRFNIATRRECARKVTQIVGISCIL